MSRYLGALHIAITKYELGWVRSDLEDAIRFLNLFIKANKMDDDNTGYTMWRDELYDRLQREYTSGTGW